ncbi:putative mitochondrial import inner membrane translocase subunit tim-50 protein [Phaeoacremonium minimum UCRPA7]|uniref:Mitochondrial import inner membrane translocase subunit TIM50 n=1 Tax=Phaeoacremonium minimum (strain UCR-PA7) TaxID=1286976 RepID=R8B994_PHAM7|nr:putative mitochondrial import inner membrane translocase subunit tim-50 protein [Phaeoacremonium minimum UCRPA7]EON95868.1 putative mitochondrial import inner membrane translocase subunit tim-50 protein [Phaeoacremonium minimum UCRPA7]
MDSWHGQGQQTKHSPKILKPSRQRFLLETLAVGSKAQPTILLRFTTSCICSLISRGGLPDLTQGIPSTLEYETTGATNRSSLTAVEDEGAAAAPGGGRGRGELPASAYISSSERRRQKWANWMFGGMAAVLAGSTVYLGRDWDEEEEKQHPDVPNGWGLGLWWNRASTRTKEVLTYYHEPAFEKLLPDPDPMFERPYTLCISLEDLLVHSEWSREHGWRVAKRPGVDYFLHYLSQYYELVLFTTVPFAIAEPLVRKLDPFRFIVWPLYREATKYKDGEIVKDLSYLNRDLSKVIIIDTSAEHVRAQPENAIILPKWTGDAKDKELVGLIPFLEYIHTMQYGDVRKVLKSFNGKHIPTEFARREAIARAEFNKQLEAEKKKHPHKGQSGIAALGSLLGLKPNSMSVMAMPDGEQNPSEAFAQGKMLQDIARERGQRNYELLEKEIRENGEKWLKEEAAMQEKAQQEAMASMKSSFTGWFVSSQDGNKPEEKKP